MENPNFHGMDEIIANLNRSRTQPPLPTTMEPPTLLEVGLVLVSGVVLFGLGLVCLAIYATAKIVLYVRSIPPTLTWVWKWRFDLMISGLIILLGFAVYTLMTPDFVSAREIAVSKSFADFFNFFVRDAFPEPNVFLKFVRGILTSVAEVLSLVVVGITAWIALVFGWTPFEEIDRNSNSVE